MNSRSEQLPVQVLETGDLFLLVKKLFHAGPSRSSHPDAQIGIPDQPFEAVGKSTCILPGYHDPAHPVYDNIHDAIGIR